MDDLVSKGFPGTSRRLCSIVTDLRFKVQRNGGQSLIAHSMRLLKTMQCTHEANRMQDNVGQFLASWPCNLGAVSENFLSVETMGVNVWVKVCVSRFKGPRQGIQLAHDVS